MAPDVGGALHEYGARELARRDQALRRVPAPVGGEPVLVVGVLEATFGAERELGPAGGPARGARHPEAEPLVLLLGLAPRALAAAAFWRRREEELPATLRGVDGAPPHQPPTGHDAQAGPLLRAALESAVGPVGHRVERLALELVHRDEPGRVPAGAVQLDARVEGGTPRQVVDEPRVALTEVISAVRAPAVLTEAAEPEDAAVEIMVEAAEQRALEPPVGTAAEHPRGARHALDRSHVHHAGQREVAVQRARGPGGDRDVADRLREEEAPVVVPLGVPVDGLVDRHAIHPERQVGRVVGAESPERGVRGEAGALALVVHLEPGRLAERLVGVDRRCAEEGCGAHLRRGGRLLPPRRCGGDRDLLDLVRDTAERVAVLVHGVGGGLLRRQRGGQEQQRREQRDEDGHEISSIDGSLRPAVAGARVGQARRGGGARAGGSR